MSTAPHRPSSLRHAHAGMYGLARHAACYDRVAGRLAEPLYRRVAADVAAAALPPGSTVLDLGTGPGRVPLHVARECPQVRVEGIDRSPEMVAHAAGRAVEEGLSAERLRYAVADVAHLPHDDGSVDMVVSSLSLHHWEDVPAGIAEIRRVLRPGGSAMIYDVGRVMPPAVRAARAAGFPVGPPALDRLAFGLLRRLTLRG